MSTTTSNETRTRSRSAKQSKKKGTWNPHEAFTASLLATLEAGELPPWRRPWVAIGANKHRNAITDRPYRGYNLLALEMTAQAHGFTEPLWLTRNQIEKAGGQLKSKQGKLYTYVGFWRWPKDQKDEDETEEQPRRRRAPFMMLYQVYNVAQADGLPERPVIQTETFEPLEAAQAILDGYPDRPPVVHHGDEAFYTPASDRVTLPPAVQFENPEEYYSVAFHEDAHSTGHPKRLARFELGTFARDEKYAREELVAEMASAFLCAEAGIDPVADIENRAAYIAGWLKQLKNDPRMVINAAQAAQKAVDHILARSASEDNDTK